MEIKKEVEVTLSVKEIETLLKNYMLKNKAIKINHVYFDVSGHEDLADWQAAMPLTYKLDRVRLIGEDVL